MDNILNQSSKINFDVPTLDVKGVFGCVFTKDQLGNILILLMKRTAQYPEKYVGVREFPGGGMMENETVVQALRRELDEEIGLFDRTSFVDQCKFWSYSMIRTKKHSVYLFFLYMDKIVLDLNLQRFITTDETDDPKLFHLNSLPYLSMTETQRELFLPIVQSHLHPFDNTDYFYQDI